MAAKALESLGISLEAVRTQVEEIIGRGGQAPSGHIPFTPRAKKVLELSLREALQLGHNYIGTEHILLGLIREGEGVAAQVLENLGADLDRVRQQVIELLGGDPRRSMPARSKFTVIAPASCSFCSTRHPSAARSSWAHEACSSASTASPRQSRRPTRPTSRSEAEAVLTGGATPCARRRSSPGPS